MYNAMLKVFVEVADYGSFSRAADALFLSPTAIMKQMNLLEKHIGLQLLIRTPRGIQLTEAGTSIYKDAKFMMKCSEEAIDRAYQAQAKDRHVIRVGTSALYPCKNLMELWNRISNSDPQLKLKVVPFEDTHTNKTRRELGKKFDVMAGVYDSTATSEFCRLLKLGTYRFCLSMSTQHRL